MKLTILDPNESLADELPIPSSMGARWVHDVDSDTDLADMLIAVGESATLEAIRGDVDVPVLPVGSVGGLPAVPIPSVESALESIDSGQGRTESIPTLGVSLEVESYRALMDVMVVTAEPARISEFRTRSRTSDIVDQVRADGVVVSSPAGTPGYGTAAGGPILDPTLEGVAVIPVGQFRTEHPHWVVKPPLSIEVIREDAPVSLVVDDRPLGRVPFERPVAIEWAEPFEVYRCPESTIPFTRAES
ncbi:MAG: hypothetical protein ACOCY6_01360 [Halodesulfurarchaeum sp.]